MFDFIEPFITSVDRNTICISAKQASDFAKGIAGDFNPIHDHDSKRFCVPGDLLFTETIRRLGLYQSMHFDFIEMLAADVYIQYPPKAEEGRHFITNSTGKNLVGIDITGQRLSNQLFAAQFALDYVQFSARSFPDILVPLMKQHGKMINPSRPLVIYQSMSFQLEETPMAQVDLTLDNSELKIDGKRGRALFSFNLSSSGKAVGRGKKKLILSGLRDYQDDVMDQLTNDYLDKKKQYLLNQV
ncbi:MAG: DUF3581 family protein [Pseudomonadota bacterium]|nr:DUF3581 family protein [Pseudomonadota bacterium]